MTAPVRPPVAWRPLAALCVAFLALLIVVSDGYGYHRDELYFIAIGGHPAFGYVDQPPLVPLLAHAIDAASGHSLVWLRVAPAVAGAVVVLVTGLLAREFGGGRAVQLLAAAAMAVSGFTLGTSHLMSTTTFDLLGWTVLSWLIVRALRTDGRVWLLAGLVAGVALEVKTLPIFFVFALAVGVLVAGPRQVFRSPWLWAGAAVALALWAPNLVWQATHGWPQLTLSKAIAAGHSGSSQPRALFIPYQFLLMCPPLCPIWLAGLWRLSRDRELALWRCLPISYGVLAVIFIATGGKPYYLCGLYPALFAAGATPAYRWMKSRSDGRVIVGTVLAVSAVVDALVGLPLVPASALHDTPIVAMNYDAGEQVGWPRFVQTVAGAYAALPPSQRAHAAVLTGNYGEAGALLRFRPGLPHVYGAQNSMWDLGPPPVGITSAIVLGFRRSDLAQWFGSVRQVATIDNGVQLDNDEQGGAVWLCAAPRQSWPELWQRMRQLG